MNILCDFECWVHTAYPYLTKPEYFADQERIKKEYDAWLRANMPKPKVKAEQYDAWKKYIKEEYGAEAKKVANDKQVGGDHYKDRMIQPWDVIDTFDHAQAIGFYKGNAIKYIIRAGSKGSAREDYEKALHYLEKLLEIL